jgi:pimeloyl-ACP methyl ester carboxylesterase
VVVLDKRGNGLSDRVTGASSLEERMDDIRAVMDAVGSTQATLFGVSEGGPISLPFAATYPARVESIVLYETFACYGDVPVIPTFGNTESSASTTLRMSSVSIPIDLPRCRSLSEQLPAAND